MSTPTGPGTFECVGDMSGGDLGSRFAVMNTVYYDPFQVRPPQQSTQAVIFDTPDCKGGRGILIPHRDWYEP